MEFNYTLTEAEMITAMKLHGKGSKKIRLLIGYIGVVLAITAIFTSYRLYPIMMITGGLIGFTVAYFVIIPYQAKKQYKELKSIQSELRISINTEGIQIDSVTGNSKLDWSHFRKWAYNDDMILFYITSRMFYMLPRRVIQDQQQFASLLKLLHEHLGGHV